MCVIKDFKQTTGVKTQQVVFFNFFMGENEVFSSDSADLAKQFNRLL